MPSGIETSYGKKTRLILILSIRPRLRNFRGISGNFGEFRGICASQSSLLLSPARMISVRVSRETACLGCILFSHSCTSEEDVPTSTCPLVHLQMVFHLRLSSGRFGTLTVPAPVVIGCDVPAPDSAGGFGCNRLSYESAFSRIRCTPR